jgi:hypothetical protein
MIVGLAQGCSPTYVLIANRRLRYCILVISLPKYQQGFLHRAKRGNLPPPSKSVYCICTYIIKWPTSMIFQSNPTMLICLWGLECAFRSTFSLFGKWAPTSRISYQRWTARSLVPLPRLRTLIANNLIVLNSIACILRQQYIHLIFMFAGTIRSRMTCAALEHPQDKSLLPFSCLFDC